MQTPHANARILVVEPDMGLRYLLVRMLEEHKYVAIGTGAMDFAREILDAGLGIRLVVSNLRLDFGGHVEFLDTIERAFPSVPILHLTGPVFQGRVPMTDRSFNAERFLAAVRRCLATGKCDPPPEERRPAAVASAI